MTQNFIFQTRKWMLVLIMVAHTSAPAALPAACRVELENLCDVITLPSGIEIQLVPVPLRHISETRFPRWPGFYGKRNIVCTHPNNFDKPWVTITTKAEDESPSGAWSHTTGTELSTHETPNTPGASSTLSWDDVVADDPLVTSPTHASTRTSTLGHAEGTTDNDETTPSTSADASTSGTSTPETSDGTTDGDEPTPSTSGDVSTFGVSTPETSDGTTDDDEPTPGTSADVSTQESVDGTTDGSTPSTSADVSTSGFSTPESTYVTTHDDEPTSITSADISTPELADGATDDDEPTPSTSADVSASSVLTPELTDGTTDDDGPTSTTSADVSTPELTDGTTDDDEPTPSTSADVSTSSVLTPELTDGTTDDVGPTSITSADVSTPELADGATDDDEPTPSSSADVSTPESVDGTTNDHVPLQSTSISSSPRASTPEESHTSEVTPTGEPRPTNSSGNHTTRTETDAMTGTTTTPVTTGQLSRSVPPVTVKVATEEMTTAEDQTTENMTSTAATCAADFVTFGNKCYYFLPPNAASYMSSDDAYTYCWDVFTGLWYNTATLLTINSAEENEFLVNYLSSYPAAVDILDSDGVWVNCDLDGRFFCTADDVYGSSSSYYVESSTGFCVILSLYNGDWYSRSCDELALVVCQYTLST